MRRGWPGISILAAFPHFWIRFTETAAAPRPSELGNFPANPRCGSATAQPSGSPRRALAGESSPALATAGLGRGSSASSASTASERTSTCSSGPPNPRTTRIVVGPDFDSKAQIPSRAINSAPIVESNAAKRSLSPRSRRNSHQTVRLHSPQCPSKKHTSLPPISARLPTINGMRRSAARFNSADAAARLLY